jgi:hypothetical protein
MSTAVAARDTREERPLTREQFARAITRAEFGYRIYRMGQPLLRRTPAEVRELRKRGIWWRRAR